VNVDSTSEMEGALRSAVVMRLHQVGLCKSVYTALDLVANSELAAAVLDALRAARADTVVYNMLASMRPKCGEMNLLTKLLESDSEQGFQAPGK
jgi:hypothetical protein